MNANPPKVHYLMHPELNVPAEATQLGFWYDKGRVVGLELRFPDKVRCLRYREIRALQRALETVPA